MLTCLSTRSESVSRPWRNINAWIGDKVAPVSLKRIALIYVTNAAGAQSFAKLTPWYDTFGSTSHGHLLFCVQSNLPLSTITPPIVVPCPPINLVAEWITISAPYSIGLTRYGVANVLSTIRGIPASCAIFATLSISTTSECLYLYCFSIFFNSCLNSVIIEWVNKCSCYSVIRKCMC